MKRFLACFLALAMAMACSCAMAEVIDLKAMSTDELLELHAQIDKEIHGRFQCAEGLMNPGTYVVGRDIKAGGYLLTGVEQTDSVHSSVMFVLYNSTEDMMNYAELTHDYLELGQSIQVNLADGMILKTEYGIVSVQPVEKPSWAP